jgi:hypothetical protein
VKRISLALIVLALGGLTAVAMAGDFHAGTTLICSDCHVMHYSQQHGYTPTGTVFPPLGPAGPYQALLRNDVNDLCLACHDNQSWAPDVFGANVTGTVRLAGGLNADPAHRANDAGYDLIDGHTLWSTASAPGSNGGYVPDTEGLECANCHSVHGAVTQYRNLRTSTRTTNIFYGDTLNYAITTNDLTKDVYERSAAAYTLADVDYNEPFTNRSRYAKWCGACHTNFHGSRGDANMGDWVRHPVADANISTSATSRWVSLTNRVKVMDSQGLWNGTTADNTVTPSCMSCHKAHGNKNGFGLIFMSGTGTVAEEGDGGVFRDMCRQCHSQGTATPALPPVPTAGVP